MEPVPFVVVVGGGIPDFDDTRHLQYTRYQGPVATTFVPPKEAGTSRLISQHLHSHMRQAHQLKTLHQHYLRPGKPFGW